MAKPPVMHVPLVTQAAAVKGEEGLKGLGKQAGSGGINGTDRPFFSQLCPWL